jgi:hypothetical protein
LRVLVGFLDFDLRFFKDGCLDSDCCDTSLDWRLASLFSEAPLKVIYFLLPLGTGVKIES